EFLWTWSLKLSFATAAQRDCWSEKIRLLAKDTTTGTKIRMDDTTSEPQQPEGIGTRVYV
ncbi:unnamed protein product, partial [Amoebophrya sp. A25]